MTFDEMESGALKILAWVEGFASTPREKIDLEGMAALARTAGRIKTALSNVDAEADLTRIGAMIAQDLSSLTAPTAPYPTDAPQPEVQNGVRGGSRGGLMGPGV